MGVNGIYGLSGSGLDIESLVKMGMTGKNKQYDKMEQQEIANTWLKEAYNDVYNDMTTYKYGTLSTYKMQSNMNAMAATSSNTGVVTATANGAAAAMNHTVTVDSVASNAYLQTTQRKDDQGHVVEDYGITRANKDAQNSNMLADVLFKKYSVANVDEDGNNATFTYNITLADGTELTDVSGSDIAISLKLKDTAGSDTEYTLTYTYDELFTGVKTGNFTGYTGNDGVFSGGKTLNDFASAIAKTGANIQGGYDTVNESFSLYNKTSGKDNVINIIVGNENTATLFNHLNLGSVNAVDGSISDRITFAEPTAMPTTVESVNSLSDITNSALSTSMKDVLGISATSEKNDDGTYTITVKDKEKNELGSFIADANGNPVGNSANATAFSMQLSNGTDSAEVKFTLGELFNLGDIGTKSSLGGNAGLDELAAKINATDLGITAKYDAARDSFSLSNPTGQAELTANGAGTNQGVVAQQLIDSLNMTNNLTYLTVNNSQDLATIFGLSTTVSKTNDGIYHLRVTGGVQDPVASQDGVSNYDASNISDDGSELFSFNISDGDQTASVSVKIGDIVNYGVITLTASNTKVKVNGQDVPKNGSVDVPNPSNNLSVLAARINDAVASAGLSITASYAEGTFSLLNPNGFIEITNSEGHKVDVTAFASSFSQGAPTSMAYKTSAGITRVRSTSSNESQSLADALGITAVKNTDGSLSVRKADGSVDTVSADTEAFSLKVGDGTGESTTVSFTYAELFDTSGTGTLKGTADFSTLADKIDGQAGLTATYDSTTGKFSLKNNAGDVILTGGDNLGSALVSKIGIAETEASKQGKEAAGQLHTWAGTNASVTIDGKTYDNDTNKLTVAGVTYNFLDVTKGAKATVSVSQDTDKIVDYVKSFVDDYNKLLDSLNEKLAEKKYSDYKPLSKRQEDEMTEKQIEKWNEKAKSGLLYHNSTIRDLVSAMREAIYTKVDAVDSEYNSLSAIGITSTNTKGHLTLDTDKLKKALAADPDCVYQLFASDQDSSYIAGSTNKNKITNSQKREDYANTGVANRLYNVMTNYMDKISDIAGTSKETDDQSYLGKLITGMKTRMSTFKTQMTAYENKLFKRYDAMEVALSRISMQLSYITNSFS